MRFRSLLPLVSAVFTSVSVPAQLTIVDIKGSYYCDDLARETGARAFANSSAFTTQTGTPAHSISNLNDGLYGDAHSWIGDTKPDPTIASGGFCGIALAHQYWIDHIAWGRANVEGDWEDRWAGTYTVQYTTDLMPDENTPATHWRTIGTYNNVESVYNWYVYSPSFRHCFSFPPVQATGVRIIVPVVASDDPANATCIDEIEIYGNVDSTKLDPYAVSGGSLSFLDFLPVYTSANGAVMAGSIYAQGGQGLGYFGNGRISINGQETALPFVDGWPGPSVYSEPTAISADGSTYCYSKWTLAPSDGFIHNPPNLYIPQAYKVQIGIQTTKIKPPSNQESTWVFGITGDGKRLAGTTFTNDDYANAVGIYYPESGSPITTFPPLSPLGSLYWIRGATGSSQTFAADGSVMTGLTLGQGPYLWDGNVTQSWIGPVLSFPSNIQYPVSISADGHVVTGYQINPNGTNPLEPWRWTKSAGSATLDFRQQANVSTIVNAMNLDGSVIVGQTFTSTSAPAGVIWTRERGEEDPVTFLSRHGLNFRGSISNVTMATSIGPYLVLGGDSSLGAWIARIPRASKLKVLNMGMVSSKAFGFEVNGFNPSATLPATVNYEVTIGTHKYVDKFLTWNPTITKKLSIDLSTTKDISGNIMPRFTDNMPVSCRCWCGSFSSPVATASIPLPVVFVHGIMSFDPPSRVPVAMFKALRELHPLYNEDDNFPALSALKPYPTLVSFDYSAELNGMVKNAGSLVNWIKTQVFPRTYADKVNLVSHSNGGIVSRYAISSGLISTQNGLGTQVNKLIMIGSPCEGAAAAVLPYMQFSDIPDLVLKIDAALSYLYFKFLNDPVPDWVQLLEVQILTAKPVVAQELLPTYEWWYGDADTKPSIPLALPNAQGLLPLINDNLNKLNSVGVYPGVKYYALGAGKFLVSNLFKNGMTLKYLRGTNLTDGFLRKESYDSGDGVVPYSSQTAAELRQSNPKWQPLKVMPDAGNVMHTDEVKNPSIINQVVQILWP